MSFNFVVSLLVVLCFHSFECLGLYGAQPALSPIRVEVNDTSAVLYGDGLSNASAVTLNNAPRVFSYLRETDQDALSISLSPGDAVREGQVSTVSITTPSGALSTSLTVYNKTGTVLSLSTFTQVQVKSNGKNVGTSNGLYQCVELIKRYYAALDPGRFGQGGLFSSAMWTSSSGLAKEYYFDDPAGKGLIRIPNDGTLPKPGDIVVFDKIPGHKSGHVALIDSEVSADSKDVEIIEQNWTTSTVGRARLSFDFSNSHKINNRGSWPVIGILRSATPVNLKPVGNFDNIDMTLGKVYGWAKDVDNPAVPVQVHIYIDKNAGTAGATPIPITASDSRMDVGAHAFNYILPALYRDGQDHVVWVWAIDLGDATGQSNVQLPGSFKTFNIASANKPPTAGFVLTSASQSINSFPPATTPQTLNLTIPVGGSATVTFDGSSPRSSDPDGSVVGWIWTINNNFATVSPVFNRALIAGTYNVTLTVTDNLGSTSTTAIGMVNITETTVTTYTSSASWNAATTGLLSVSFDGIAPNGGFVFVPTPPGITRNGVTVSINTSESNGALFAIGKGSTFHPETSVLTTQQSTLANNNMLISLPGGFTAVSFVMSTNSPPSTLRLSTGDVVAISTLPFPQLTFFGVTSTTPITSLEIINGSGFDLQTVSFGRLTGTGGDGWPMSGYNGQRTNQSKATGPKTLPQFQALLSSPPASLNLINPDGSLIFFDGNSLYSYTNDGVLHWREAIPVYGNPYPGTEIMIGPSGVIYSITPNQVWAWNKDTGAKVWPNPVTIPNSGDERGSSIVDRSGNLYINTGANYIGVPQTLTSISPGGTIRWQSGFYGRGYYSPVLSDDQTLVYIYEFGCDSFCGTGYTHALDTTTGRVLYTTGYLGLGVFAPWNVLFASSFDGTSQPPGVGCTETLSSCPTVPGNSIRAISGSNVAIATVTPSSSTIGLSPQGAQLFAKAEPYSALIGDAAGTVFAVASTTNDIVAFTASTGVELWRQHFVSTPAQILLGDDGCLYVSGSSTLYKACH